MLKNAIFPFLYWAHEWSALFNLFHLLVFNNIIEPTPKT